MTGVGVSVPGQRVPRANEANGTKSASAEHLDPATTADPGVIHNIHNIQYVTITGSLTPFESPEEAQFLAGMVQLWVQQLAV